tara:strand:+ start:30 stop:611 length:582 start_codon:yes stop_codon:yes gene_type:complete
MKKYANIVLLAILAALFYKTPSFLIESVGNPMGNLSWMVIIFVVYQMIDSVSAIILAIIMITLLHQSTTEGFEGKEEESEKSPEEEIAEMEEKEMKKGASDKMKKTKKEKKSNKEVVEEEEEEEEEEVPVKEGFELIKKSEKECETYDKEGFTGFTEILKKFKIPITTTNTTDLDRELKASAERSTLDSSKEF